MHKCTYSIMNFRMSGIGCISDVNMAVDSLTVILGENGAGKSTILKGLYSVAEAPVDFQKKKEDEATETLLGLCKYLVFKSDCSVETTSEIKKILTDLDETFRPEDILQTLKTALENDTETYTVVSEKVAFAEKVLNGESDSEFLTQLIKRNLGSEFAEISQIHSHGSYTNGKIELISDLWYCSVRIDQNDKISWDGNPNAVFSTAVYYDTPFILDHLFSDDPSQLIDCKHRTDLCRAISSCHTNIVDELISAGSAERFRTLLKTIINSGFIRKQNRIQYIDRNGKHLDTLNLAAGFKTFAILKLLAENGKLTKNSLILLDEPEAYLHPEWQNTLAELIILLVKDVGAKVVMTTHSPQMLLAIQAYSAEHKQSVDYYALEDIENGKSSFTDLHGDLSSEYRKMADAYDAMYELYNRSTDTA